MTFFSSTSQIDVHEDDNKLSPETSIYIPCRHLGASELTRFPEQAIHNKTESVREHKNSAVLNSVPEQRQQPQPVPLAKREKLASPDRRDHDGLQLHALNAPTAECEEESGEECEDEYETMVMLSPQQDLQSQLLTKAQVHDGKRDEEVYIPVSSARIRPTEAHSSPVLEDTDNKEVLYINVGSRS